MNTTAPVKNFAYDNAGNTTGDGQFTSTFNLAGRMATLTKAGVTTTYSVDAFGRRVRKFSSTGKASTVIYVYDQQGQLLGEYDSAGVALREYVWLNSTPVAVFTPDPTGATKPPLVYYIHTDHLDAPRVVVDKNNAARWSWLAEPFGTTAANGNPSGLGSFSFSLRLPGQVFDAESGLHYNFFRDYDAGSGRYTQSDPIGLAGGINTYGYVSSAPTMYTDPDGLEPRSTGRLPVLVCVYRQAIQDFTCIDESSGRTVVAGSCYSGTGVGRNNPAMNGEPSVGPTPRGWWDVGLAQDTRLGRPSFRLSPDADNSVFQTRRQPQSFLIHADNAASDASEGCTICEKRIRDIIAKYPGSRMVVQ